MTPQQKADELANRYQLPGSSAPKGFIHHAF